MGDGLHVWVYILRCADGSYYVGSTKRDEPEAREWNTMPGWWRATPAAGDRSPWSTPSATTS